MSALTRTTRRGRRGIALLATVAISVIASVAAMVVITLTLDSTRAESTTLNRMEAIEAIESAQTRFEEELLVAPLFFYTSVFDLERARVCVVDESQVVQPGSAWPRECGTTWEYVQADDPGDVRLEISPPSNSDPRLMVRILSNIGGYEIGIEATYALDSTARYSLYSQEDLDLSVLPHETASSVAGEVYSGGTIALPQWELTSSSGVVSAEDGFPRAPEESPYGANPVRFYGGIEDIAGDVAVYDIRELYPVEPEVVGMRASFASVVDLACQGEVALVDGAATRFCLRAGDQLVNGSGDLVDVPEGASSYLVLPGAGASAGVLVYWSGKTSEAPATCGGGCDLASDSGTSIAAGTHPGDASFWTLLGEFPEPVGGVIHTDRDTHIGLCGGAFVEVDGSCTAWDAGGGVEIDSHLTIVVGTLVEPADVWLSGPVRVASGASFGAVASGRTLLPYWARTAGSDGIVEGAYTALGVGVSGDSVAVWPAVIEEGGNAGGVLRIKGGFAGTSIDTEFALYDSIVLTNFDRHWTAPPPLYPSATGEWRVVHQRRLTSVEVCGSTVCTAF